MNASRALWLSLAATALLGVGFALGLRWPAPASRRVAPAADAGNVSGIGRSAGQAPAPGAVSETVVAGSLSAAPSARDIVDRLAALKVTAQDPRNLRSLLVQLEKLREQGGAALPAIRAFLGTGQDVDYDSGMGRGLRGATLPLNFTVPPSLRLGLMEVLYQIGGADAEAILLHELQTTGRGVEAAYLGGLLQSISKEKYRDAALASARDLLAMPLMTSAQNSLDRSDREYLYGMLAVAEDPSQVAQARAQLLLPNGQVDQGALRYLRQMLGEQVVEIASAAWHDPRVSASQREPLARVALAFVGVIPTADQLYRLAIDDPALSSGARKNLIEDLNETGFADPKHLTSADLPLIQKRLELIEQLAPRARDRNNAAAFVEARKDLLNMRDAVQAAASPPRK